jgi:hypothetical protein
LLDTVTNKFYIQTTGNAFSAGPVSNTKYPIQNYNRWIQTVSPNSNYNVNNKSFFINTDFAHNNRIGALTKSNSSDKSVYSANSSGDWWAPIGQKKLYDNKGIPAADGTTQTSTELWIRIDNLPKTQLLKLAKE